MKDEDLGSFHFFIPHYSNIGTTLPIVNHETYV